MKQGDIYLTDFSPSKGHEYKKERPAVIISGNSILKGSSLITVMPITSNTSGKVNDNIEIKKDKANKLYKDSIIKVKDIHSFDPIRFKAKIGEVSDDILAQIKSYIPKHFNL
ncbi:type II toxin-antitoxin system PemK/MazF family toxin [Patescibacteria group bacterium]|nr:type II toxin-antitoxin system PemK/MazF family toxin [Patescibacteria group bacterium]MBU1682549.1 type II toxin-antitoxin system PemK/MazF family toxin [Patescibacteria group bacterium]MBU1934901.1 type II toxin-antitoxin system PemK/MazF family toxin [Patescibacteria group bacterium]